MVNTDLPAPAQFSGIRKSRKHSIYSHFSKGEKLRRLLENQNDKRLLAEDALTKLYLGQKKFGDLITADYKVFNEGCDSRDDHRYAVVVQELSTQCYSQDKMKGGGQTMECYCYVGSVQDDLENRSKCQ